MPKRSQRGAKGALKGVKCWKKGMPKMMPNFDTEKKNQNGGFHRFWMDFWSGLGGLGGG